MDNRTLNKRAWQSACIFNGLLLTAVVIFLWSDYNNVNAQSVSDGASAEVTFYEDRTFAIKNGTMKIQGDYIFTNPSSEEIDYTQEGIKFKSNGTLIL